ncbi:MAG: Minf_1886 family protein [Planctomycetota bacterium]
MEDSKLQPLIRQTRILNERRYAEAAYYFVLEALDYTIFLAGRGGMEGSRHQEEAPADAHGRHISPQELLGGIRRYAREEFGPLAPYAFRSWGVHDTADFGTIVFQMCETGLLKKTDRDRPQDFADGFDFQEAFADTDLGGS